MRNLLLIIIILLTSACYADTPDSFHVVMPKVKFEASQLKKTEQAGCHIRESVDGTMIETKDTEAGFMDILAETCSGFKYCDELVKYLDDNEIQFLNRAEAQQLMKTEAWAGKKDVEEAPIKEEGEKLEDR